jgi:hypothetical protein
MTAQDRAPIQQGFRRNPNHYVRIHPAPTGITVSGVPVGLADVLTGIRFQFPEFQDHSTLPANPLAAARSIDVHACIQGRAEEVLPIFHGNRDSIWFKNDIPGHGKPCKDSPF